MKKLLPYLLFFLLPASGNAQVYKLFINSRDEICDSAKAKAFILYTAGPDSLWHTREYFMNGSLRLKGTYKDPNLQISHGRFSYYHTEDSVHYKRRAGLFIDGEKEGIWTEHYPNSSLKMVQHYKKGKKNGEYRNYFRDSKEIYIRGSYSDGLVDGEWTTFDKYRNVTKVEIWEKDKLISQTKPPLVYRKPAVSAKFEAFIESVLKDQSNGQNQPATFVIGASLADDGKLANPSLLSTYGDAARLSKKILEMLQQAPAWEPAYNEKEKKGVKDSVAFVIWYSKAGINTELCRSAIRPDTSNKNLIEISPMPHGGWKRFYSRIQSSFSIRQDVKLSNFKSPIVMETEENKDIKGRIVLTFKVEHDGRLSELKVIRGLKSDVNEAAIRAVKGASSGWFPGIRNNKPVKVSFTLPLMIDVTGAIQGSFPNE